MLKKQTAHSQQDVTQAGQQIDDSFLALGLCVLHIGVV
jgi:hypothetical protein